MDPNSRTPTLTPSRSPSPEPPVQPDHFYGAENIQLPPSPDSDGKTWLNPEDDLFAHRGIPVFKPTMKEFEDFEGYMTKVECWGKKSGIVKVIPPKEWTDALPSVKPQLAEVQIKTPIEQIMLGRGGLFRQENLEKRKFMSVREWVELCSKDEFRALGVQEVGVHSRSANVTTKPKGRKSKKKGEAVKAESAGPGQVAIKEEPLDDYHQLANGFSSSFIVSPPNSNAPASPSDDGPARSKTVKTVAKPKAKGRRVAQTREAREAGLADRAARDKEFLGTFEPHDDWLPPNTKATDYTPEFCQKLERQYWRNCGLSKPAWYGADTQGSLFTDNTTAWNVAHLPSMLSRILPSSDKGLPGVNTPYLYFGMWRATFAWHVEDMDLFSINYIHFGAPKFWYAVPQARAAALEQTMRGYFPGDTSKCPQFLRHKSFLASPTLLAQSACRPNYLVQQAGEFVITFPRGYHAGFNLGLNCAESVNFALDSWLEMGRRAKACECISDSVRIDVDQLLRDREEESLIQMNLSSPSKTKRSVKKVTLKMDNVKLEAADDVIPPPAKNPRKRKSDAKDEAPKIKRIKLKASPSKAGAISAQISSKSGPPKISITLKLGPRPAELEPYPCCLCISRDKVGLLRVQDPPVHRKDAADAAGNPKLWLAHEQCANVVPETWVDEITNEGVREKVIFGVDGIVKDRWNLKCSACTKSRPKVHGAPVQCTKGKCPKAFHVSCAQEGHSNGIVFSIIREVEKEVVLSESYQQGRQHILPTASIPADSAGMAVDGGNGLRVLSIIKKAEVQILCTQHNPAVAAAKKANKQDKIKNDLMALPSMSRIKIRVSAGVFEVSLIRVIEETNSVEVLWDRGVKREFKWGSVVFGSTDGPVLQKPSELLVETETSNNIVPTYPSVTAATAKHTHSSAAQMSSGSRNPGTDKRYTTYPYATPSGSYDYWQHGQTYTSATQSSYPYGYGSYYPTSAVPGSSQQYNPYSYPQYKQINYNGQMNWQQMYPSQGGQNPYSSTTVPHTTSSSTQYDSTAMSQSTTSTSALQSHPYVTDTSVSTSSGPDHTRSSTNANQPPPQFNELAPLSSLDPSQIADILRSNPALREMVLAAVGQAKTKS